LGGSYLLYNRIVINVGAEAKINNFRVLVPVSSSTPLNYIVYGSENVKKRSRISKYFSPSFDLP
jgi:hypothetical protein